MLPSEKRKARALMAEDLTLDESERLLAENRTDAETKARELGHTMGLWRFNPVRQAKVTQSSICTSCGAMATVARRVQDSPPVADDRVLDGSMDFATLMRCPNAGLQIVRE